MREDLDEALVRDFPNLYADRFGDMHHTAMCWGFDCGDGWEPIIRRLSEKLEAMIVALPEPQEVPAHDGKFGHCEAYTPQKPRASQVKEKFGGLVMYLTRGTDEMYTVIDEAERESLNVCEDCGSKTNVSTKGKSWIRTLCSSCRKEQK